MPEITIRFGEREFLRDQALLEELYPHKTTLAAKAKRALKDTLRAARMAKREKRKKSGDPIIEGILAKSYYTSKGDFIKVRNMDPAHVYNAVRKMERTARTMRDENPGHMPTPPDVAYPSTPQFAGYSDLIAILKWNDKNKKPQDV